MTRFAVVIETTQIEAIAERLAWVGSVTIGEASVRAVNAVATRGFDESVKRMTARVNLSEAYVRDRMTVEPANDARKPEATIVAFRAGGRRPGTRPVNLRQYAMVQLQQPVRFTNSDPRIANGRIGMNPRKQGSLLPWKKRTGDPQAGIPLGQKAAGVSVEVIKGDRKVISFAFQRRMKNGEILVMARKADQRGVGKGKGKIESLHSLSVWQLFRSTAPEVIPFIADDLERSAIDELDKAIESIIP